MNPQLSVDDAWDVAAYVLSQPRPNLAGIAHDFPNLLLKPVDTPYGPYADHFSEQQHKYGPFAPIRAAIEQLKKAGGPPLTGSISARGTVSAASFDTSSRCLDPPDRLDQRRDIVLRIPRGGGVAQFVFEVLVAHRI